MNNLTLIVIDDEPLIGDFVCDTAKQVGFNTLYFNSGQTLIDSNNKDQIEIIILDLMMPEIDGIEMIRYIARNMPKVSIILMSGVDTSILHSAQELALEHGLNFLGVLQKPFHPSRLCQILLDWKKNHTDSFTDDTPLSDNSNIEITELCDAINTNQLIPYFQPQVSLQNHTILGFEVLIRWQHPERGLVMPNDFIPMAQKGGLINQLSWQLIKNVVQQWQQFGFLYTLSVNMPAGIFKILDMPERLESIFKKYPLDPSQLILEITETAIMEELVKSLDCLTRLRMKGFQLSIDDFGTGYSSLIQLHRAPVSEIKIDMQFVKKMEYDKEALAIVETVILLAKKLGHTVVAEGVETADIYSHLGELGADIAQGYYIAKPMPANEIKGWISHWQQTQS